MRSCFFSFFLFSFLFSPFFFLFLFFLCWSEGTMEGFWKKSTRYISGGAGDNPGRREMAKLAIYLHTIYRPVWKARTRQRTAGGSSLFSGRGGVEGGSMTRVSGTGDGEGGIPSPVAVWVNVIPTPCWCGLVWYISTHLVTPLPARSTSVEPRVDPRVHGRGCWTVPAVTSGCTQFGRRSCFASARNGRH